MNAACVRGELIESLAETLRHRREGCPVIYSIELSSAQVALGLSQEEVNEAVRLSEMEEATR